MARKSLVFTSVVLSCSILLSGCAIGFNAPTNQQKPTGNGRSTTVGQIDVRGATIVIDPAKPEKAAFVGTIINTATTEDTFKALQVGSSIGATVPAEISLPTQQPAQIGFESPLSIVIPTNNMVKAGDFVNVRLLFANNVAIPMSLIVNTNDGVYEGVKIP